MATVEVLTASGGRAGQIELDPAIFEGKIREHLFHAEVRRQLARRRAGTHSTKNRAAVSGGGIKPWKQKGTGRARQGTIRAPQWAGGGTVFGPTPVKALLDCEKQPAREAFVQLADRYPIAVIRDLSRAKQWIRAHARGTERFGLVASRRPNASNLTPLIFGWTLIQCIGFSTTKKIQGPAIIWKMLQQSFRYRG